MESGLFVAALCAVVAVAASFAYFSERMQSSTRHRMCAAALRILDEGPLRILWATYSIVHSALSLNVVFPPPFTIFIRALSIFSFDFFSMQCFFPKSKVRFSGYRIILVLCADFTGQFYAAVLLWGFGPIGAIFSISIAGCLRSALARSHTRSPSIFSRHIRPIFYVTFFTLPISAMTICQVHINSQQQSAC